jgi:hypothetical protein
MALVQAKMATGKDVTGKDHDKESQEKAKVLKA